MRKSAFCRTCFGVQAVVILHNFDYPDYNMIAEPNVRKLVFVYI